MDVDLKVVLMILIIPFVLSEIPPQFLASVNSILFCSISSDLIELGIEITYPLLPQLV